MKFQDFDFNSTDSGYFTMCFDMYEGVVFWACSSILLCLLGFPACSMVFWEMFQRHRRGTPTTPNDVFMLNLTAMDMVFLGFVPPGVCNYLVWRSFTFESYIVLLNSLNLIGRPLLMTCICVDCYLAVVHPITYRATKGLTPRVLMSSLVWVSTLTYGAALFTFANLYYETVSVWPYVISLPTIGFCDFFILRALKSSDPAGRDLHPQKKKARQVIINSLVMAVIAYLPQLSMRFFQYFLPENINFCRVIFPLSSSSIAGSAIMPVLYLGNLQKLDFISVWCSTTG